MTESGPAPEPPDAPALASGVLASLRAEGHTLATAESLTGGLLVSALTSVPGASDVVLGGLAAYATDVKSGVLGVDPEVMATHGVVSAETSGAMARRAVALFGCTWAVATTGVAGPDRLEGRPVGTVFVAVAGPVASDSAYGDGSVAVRRLALSGGRDDIRAATVSAALLLLRDRLDHGSGERSRV